MVGSFTFPREKFNKIVAYFQNTFSQEHLWMTVSGNYKSSRSQEPFKIGVLKITQNDLIAFFFTKEETPAQILSCEFSKIFKNMFLEYIYLRFSS